MRDGNNNWAVESFQEKLEFRKILWGMETQKGACFALSKAGLCLERSYEGWKLSPYVTEMLK